MTGGEHCAWPGPQLALDRVAASREITEAWKVETEHLLVRAAVDAAVCELADVVAGNSWSSFDQELALHHSDVDKPALIYNAPGGRVAIRTDRGLLTVPADCTRPVAGSVSQLARAAHTATIAQSLFHMPISLCSDKHCGTWGLVVREDDTPMEAVGRFFMHVIPETVGSMLKSSTFFVCFVLIEVIAPFTNRRECPRA